MKQDWGALDDINQRKLSPDMKNIYQDKLASLKQRYEELSQ